MTEESGIDKTLEEETPEVLRKQIKTLKIDLKVFKYISVIAPISAMIYMAALFIYKEGDMHPVKVYSVSKVQDGIGDLDGNGIHDLVLEQEGGYRTLFFGHKFNNSITYIKYDEMEKLNSNSTVDYECIDNVIGRNSPVAWLGDKQKRMIDEERRKLEEQGFNPTGIKCIKGGSNNSDEWTLQFKW